MTGYDLDDAAVVAAGAVALLSGWLPWYEARDGSIVLRGFGLGLLAALAVLLSVYAAGRVVLTRNRPPKPDVPVTPQAETFAVAALALVLMVYRILDAPTISGRPSVRAYGIVVGGLAIFVQVVCAARKLGRTGVRAT